MNCEIRNCGKEINYDDALLFGPPDAEFNTKKIHICKLCYKKFYEESIVSIKNPPTSVQTEGYFVQKGKMDTIGLFQGPQRIESYKPKTEDYFIMDYHLPAVIQSPPSEPRLVGPIPCRCCCRC